MTAHPIHDSTYSWFRLAISVVIASIGTVGIWAIVMVMPAMQAEYGVGRGDASLPFTITMVGFAFGNLVFGRMIDRYGVVICQIAAAIIASAGFFAATFAPSIWTMTAIQFVVGFGSAAGFGPLAADVSHWFMKRRGIAVAFAASGNYVAGAFWPLVLTPVLEDYGWRWVYYSLAAAIILLVPPLTMLIRRRAPEGAMAVAATAAAARTRSVGFSPRTLQILLCVAGLGCCVAMSMPQVHIIAYCVDLGYGPAVGSEMLSMMLLAGVASRVLSGMLSDWLGGVPTVLLGSILQCLALFLYLPFDGLVSLYIVSTIFGLSQGGLVPGYAVIVREYMPPKEAGARVGTVLMMTVFGMALGGWMSGWIYDLTGSYEAAFLNGIAWNLLNFAIIIMLFIRSGGLSDGGKQREATA